METNWRLLKGQYNKQVAPPAYDDDDGDGDDDGDDDDDDDIDDDGDDGD